MIDWISTNKDWLGIVVPAILAIGGYLLTKQLSNRKNKQVIKGKSKGIQAGRNININKK